ncbi:MAG: signal peptidase II [Deltaproteobacteria bacterium]|nr:signal peptidase II [Deltaproteobacteria bacterium]
MTVIAGRFGNLYDRAFNDGKVVDFMPLSIGPLRTGAFNVADISILVGISGFMFIDSKWGQQLTNKSTWT